MQFRPRRRRRWPWVLGSVAVMLVAGLAYVLLAWPRGTLAVDEAGLPQVQLQRLAGSLLRVSVRSADGAPVPVALRPDGTLWPTRRVIPGTRLFAEAVFRRPGWISWITGHTQTARLELVAPSARLSTRWPRVAAGAPLRVSFDRPVREVEVTGVRPPRTLRLPRPVRTVVLGRFGDAGSVGVRAVAQAWERLPPPTTVTWFPPGKAAMLLASPTPGSQFGPAARLRLRFSEPAAAALHGRMPSLEPPAPGRWRKADAHTLEFVPRGYGFGLDGRVQLKLPVPVRIGAARRPIRTITWTTPVASELRLEELLALLRYIPLRWTATKADAARTVSGQIAAAVHPPAGRFDWRYPDTPPPLVALWQPGRFNAIVRGAIMAFESEHGLAVDGFAGRHVWQAMIADVIAGKPRANGYSYVFVHSSVPQSLNLWHNGHIVLSSPGNTGVPAAPTQLGTFPVFEHIPVGTMSGTNPDGSHYRDPGIRYISYFNHGEGIHAFKRASFGTPQSLGCVELPLAAAAKVWPYTPIGTLVTVER
ncbi:MAG TPA: L,D-transpeptidase family protein [Gaiellaceae bacterium]|nr:L,D-transpeptidase family protein [Gaiellaceae bacterium]